MCIVTWSSLLPTVGVLLFVTVPESIGYPEFLHNNASRFSMSINIQSETNQSHAESLSIFELVTISKLQTFAQDVRGVGSFQEPFWASTTYLVNLLDSSQWNLNKAKRKFRKAMEWRANSFKFVNRVPEENLFEYFSIEAKGYDKEGCPVVIVPLGEWRTYRSYVEEVKSIDIANTNLKIYFANVMEEILQPVKKNLLCSHITLIADMEGYILHHNSGIKFFTDTIKHFGRSYPGILKIAFIINCSPKFLKVAKSFKSTIPWDLRRKSFIYTTRNFWEPELQKQIDPSQLTPKYGGENFYLES